MRLVTAQDDNDAQGAKAVATHAARLDQVRPEESNDPVLALANIDELQRALEQRLRAAGDEDDAAPIHGAARRFSPWLGRLPLWLLVKLCCVYLSSCRERSRLRSTLQRSLPSAALERLESGAWTDCPERMLATVMFGDIEGFTALGESVAPEALMALLNQYFTLVSMPIRLHAGVITQYQGDAFVAVFHIPATERNHARDAVEAALDIQRVLRDSRFAGERRLRSRIGIATGEIAAGFVGSSLQANFTIHGDTVNLAARLEQLNKQLGTGILLAQATALLAGRDLALDCRGCYEIEGKAEPCTVFEPAAAGG